MNNFILIYYVKENFNYVSDKFNHFKSVGFLSEWQRISKLLFEQQIEQLRKKYPQSNIHVITNKLITNSGIIVHHKPDMPTGHSAKFLVYSLLDKPAMYLDCDILLIKPFEKHHLIGSPFNFFHARRFNHKLVTNKNIDINILYDCSCIWVSEPCTTITEEMKKIHEEYYSDVNFISSNGAWPHNDEYAATNYVIKNNLNITLCNEVSETRSVVDHIKKYQSVHYGGIDFSTKQLCLKEYSLLNKIKFV